jgi:hypothetical protein
MQRVLFISSPFLTFVLPSIFKYTQKWTIFRPMQKRIRKSPQGGQKNLTG